MVAFWVHTEIYVRTHIATQKGDDSFIHIKRPEKYVRATIEHEAIHVRIVKDWHDKSEPEIKVDFDSSHEFESFDLCESYRRGKFLSWRNSWFEMKRNHHSRPEFENDPSIGSGIDDLVPDGSAAFKDDPDGAKEFWKWTFDGR